MYDRKTSSWQPLKCSLFRERMTSLLHTPVIRVRRTYEELRSHHLGSLEVQGRTV